ncbi:uncharacterized protein LOC142337672 [Convolutriloba macropyga]|uniref:uncharacterized protein LOC142337672 n=1 Tax=Convolutriloba macropyga TaxID=536237 RepID=UPI003F51E50A
MEILLATVLFASLIECCNSSINTFEERLLGNYVQNCTQNRVHLGSFILHRSGLCENGFDGDVCKVHPRPYAKPAPQLEMSHFKVTKITEYNLICLENIHIKSLGNPEDLEGLHVEMTIDGKNRYGYYSEFEYSQTEFFHLRDGTFIPLQPDDTIYCIKLKNGQLRDIENSSMIEARLWITPLPAIFTYPYREPEQYTAPISHISKSTPRLDKCFKHTEPKLNTNYSFIAVGIFILVVIVSFPIHVYLRSRFLSSDVMPEELQQGSDTHLLDA